MPGPLFCRLLPAFKGQWSYWQHEETMLAEWAQAAGSAWVRAQDWASAFSLPTPFR